MNSQKLLGKDQSKKSKKMRSDLLDLMERRKLTMDKSRSTAVKKRKKMEKEMLEKLSSL